MEVKAITRYVRQSAFKARAVTRDIQGLPAQKALTLLEFYPQKAARFVWKTLKSAIANAENNHSLNPDLLVVKEATVGEAPTIKRFRPRARGSASPIAKRTCHIRVIVAEYAEEPVAKKKQAADGRKKARRVKKPAADSGKATEAKE
jgi:large subunit ribosomal protein L22